MFLVIYFCLNILLLLLLECIIRPDRVKYAFLITFGDKIYHAINHKLWMDEDKLIGTGLIGTCDLQIDAPALCQLSQQALLLAVSLFCQYLCSGGGGGEAPVRSHSTIYCPLARDHSQVTIQPRRRQ